jgi:hypothetical protein
VRGVELDDAPGASSPQSAITWGSAITEAGERTGTTSDLVTIRHRNVPIR